MDKSTTKFAKYFYKIIEEDMTAADAGVGSTGGAEMQGAGVYGDADDMRLPKVLGKVQRRADVDPKKKKKKSVKMDFFRSRTWIFYEIWHFFQNIFKKFITWSICIRLRSGLVQN